MAYFTSICFRLLKTSYCHFHPRLHHLSPHYEKKITHRNISPQFTFDLTYMSFPSQADQDWLPNVQRSPLCRKHWCLTQPGDMIKHTWGYQCPWNFCIFLSNPKKGTAGCDCCISWSPIEKAENRGLDLDVFPEQMQRSQILTFEQYFQRDNPWFPNPVFKILFEQYFQRDNPRFPNPVF